MGKKNITAMINWRLSAWWRWRKKAIHWSRVHPPFAFALLQSGWRARRGVPEFEAFRRRLHHDLTALQLQDYGAGSQRHASTSTTTVSQWARKSLKRRRHAAAVGAWAATIEARRVLELGTCLGVTTAYLAGDPSAGPPRQVTTLEGNRDRLAVAQRGWKTLDLSDAITPISGRFDDTLPSLLATTAKPFDLIFIDGHHEGDAMLRYVDLLLPVLAEDGLLVCDDIHWSADMEAAWHTLRQRAEWTFSMDVFEMGVLSRRRGLTRQDFTIRHSGFV